MAFIKKLARGDIYVVDFMWGNNASLLTVGSVAYPVRDYLEIIEAAEAHTTAGTNGSAVTGTIEKLTGTQAPGAGANMFKTSTFDLKTAANTVSRLTASSLTGLSVAQRAAQFLSPGDRIGFTFTGTLTTLAGVACTVILRPTRPAATKGR